MIYQLTFLLQNEADKAVVNKTVASVGAKVVHERVLGRKTLIYPIKQVREAFYFTYHIDIDPATITTLEQKLNFDETIVRFLIIKTEKIIMPMPAHTGAAPKVIEKPIEIPEILPVMAGLPAVPEKVEKAVAPKGSLRLEKPAPAPKPVKVEKKEKKPTKISAQDETKRLQALEEKLQELLKE